MTEVKGRKTIRILKAIGRDYKVDLLPKTRLEIIVNDKDKDDVIGYQY